MSGTAVYNKKTSGSAGHFRVVRVFRNKEITADAEVTEGGISVFVRGGDLAHVGAVSAADVADNLGLGTENAGSDNAFTESENDDCKVSTVVFPGHRDDAVSEKWAKALLKKFAVTVSVSAGIHYDNVSKEDISEILRITDEMLAELTEKIKRSAAKNGNESDIRDIPENSGTGPDIRDNPENSGTGPDIRDIPKNRVSERDIIDIFRNREPSEIVSEVAQRGAVCIPLIRTENGFDILFEVRSPRLKGQPGDVCFPGGGIEEGETPEEAALRECREELLLEPDDIELAGPMDIYRSEGTIIYPFVTDLKNYSGTFSDDEVCRVFRVPLSFFLETEPERYAVKLEPKPSDDFPYGRISGGKNYRWRKREITQLFYDYDGITIWGLTAKIVYAFAKAVREGR